MAGNLAIVHAFIESWRSRDLKRIMSFLTEDCFYHNMPWDPLRGHEQIIKLIGPFLSQTSEVEWIVHHAAESAGGVVLTERTDRFLLNGQWLELPVMGAFELRDGRIAAWRDYFDAMQFDAAMAAISPAPARDGM